MFSDASWISPRTAIATALFAQLLIFVSLILYAAQEPRLGIVFQESLQPEGLIIVRIKGHNEGKIPAGTLVTGISDQYGSAVIPLTALALRNPLIVASLASFAEYDDYLAYQQQLWDILSSDKIVLYDQNNNAYPLARAVAEQLADLPFATLFVHFFVSLVMLSVGVWVWSIRRNETPAILLLVSTVGFTTAVNSGAFYFSYELAMPAELSELRSTVNRFGENLFGFALLACLWVYPARLGSIKMVYLIFGLALAVFLAITFRWIELPVDHFRGHYFIFWLVSLYLVYRQWQASKGNPTAMAMFKWFIGTVMLVTLTAFILFALPPYLGLPPLVSYKWYLVLWIFIPLGLALGILKYQLFNIDRWWFYIWLWFISGFFVILVDILLAHLLTFSEGEALFLSLLIIGWVYFPIRQQALKLYGTNRGQLIEEYLPRLLRAFYEDHSPDEQWKKIIQDLFTPLRQIEEDVDVDLSIDAKNAVSKDGLEMRVSGVSFGKAIRLSGKKHGSALFSPRDYALAQSLLRHTREFQVLREAEKRSINEERHRIMRDLHDDVGAKILTLIHRLDGKDAIAARSALQSLRDTIYVLDGSNPVFLADFVDDMRLEIQERVSTAQSKLYWFADEFGNTQLSRRCSYNLTRILREGVTNVLKHAQSDYVIIHLHRMDNYLSIEIINGGSFSDPSLWIKGSGINHIQSRGKEIAGSIEWIVNHPKLEPNSNHVTPEHINRDSRELVLRITLPLSHSYSG